MRFTEEEVMSYCRDWANTLAQEIRRCGVSCRDSEFVFPVMASLEGVLGDVGVDDFFYQSKVFVYGLNFDDCVEYTERMREAKKCYLEYDDFEKKAG